MLTLPAASSTGAIAGTSTGTIENIYVDGKVTGGSNTGGIVGTLHAGTLQNSTLMQKFMETQLEA